MRLFASTGIILLVVIGGIFIFYKKAEAPRSEQVGEQGPEQLLALKVGNKTLWVERALTSEEITRGLMHREHLPKDRGMLFIFPESNELLFWNKNTLIALDVIWVRSKNIIGVSKLQAIKEGLQTVVSPELADAVLEVNSGWMDENGIKVGDKLEW